MKIGLFGGSFDPVHNAHVALAHVALDTLGLDQVWWIPAGLAWQKARRLTDGWHREAMLRLAIADEPRFVVDTCELRRTGPSYTLDTVRELQTAHHGHEWFLIIGQDQYAGMHSWVGWEELLGRVQLAVANRPGVMRPVSAEVQRVKHHAVPLSMMENSSTDIRSRLAAGQGIEDLVPVDVARYIDKYNLYRGTAGS